MHIVLTYTRSHEVLPSCCYGKVRKISTSADQASHKGFPILNVVFAFFFVWKQTVTRFSSSWRLRIIGDPVVINAARISWNFP
jgi:hypothetical protein